MLLLARFLLGKRGTQSVDWSREGCKWVVSKNQKRGRETCFPLARVVQ